MPSHLFPGLPMAGYEGRLAPPSFSLDQVFTTDADGRAWMSSTDTADIWSCAVLGTQLCDYMSEASNC